MRTLLHGPEALPDAPLRGRGRWSRAFGTCGCATFRDAARHVRALPYGRNRDRADPALVLAEGHGTCSTKHALLALLAREQGLPVTLVVGLYEMDDRNTPGVGSALAAHGLASVPEAHCYLRHGDRRVDVTREATPGAAPITAFLEEHEIAPEGIGERKVAIHRAFLARWLSGRPDVAMTLDALWTAREACIRALAAPAGDPGSGA